MEAAATPQFDYSDLPRNTLELVASLLPAPDLHSLKQVCKAFSTLESCCKVAFAVDNAEGAAAALADTTNEAYILTLTASFERVNLREPAKLPAAVEEAAALMTAALPATCRKLALSEAATLPGALVNLARLPHLQHLRLQLTAATAPGINRTTALAALPRLQSLHLTSRQTWSSDWGFPTAPADFELPVLPASLETLTVQGLKLIDTDWVGLSARCPTLRHLDASDSDVRQLSPASLAGVHTLEAARAQVQVNSVVQLGQLEGIRVLNLNHTIIFKTRHSKENPWREEKEPLAPVPRFALGPAITHFSAKCCTTLSRARFLLPEDASGLQLLEVDTTADIAALVEDIAEGKAPNLKLGLHATDYKQVFSRMKNTGRPVVRRLLRPLVARVVSLSIHAPRWNYDWTKTALLEGPGGINSFASLRHLEMRGQEYHPYNAPIACLQLPQLKTCSIVDSDFQEVDLTGCPSLQKLILVGASSHGKCEHFSVGPSLQTLVCCQALKGSALARLAAQAPRLDTLVLQGHGIPRLPPIPPRLRRLALVHTPAAGSMRNALALPRLQQLGLTQVPGPADARILSRLPFGCKWAVHERMMDLSGNWWDSRKPNAESLLTLVARDAAEDWCRRIVKARGREVDLAMI